MLSKFTQNYYLFGAGPHKDNKNRSLAKHNAEKIQKIYTDASTFNQISTLSRP